MTPEMWGDHTGLRALCWPIPQSIEHPVTRTGLQPQSCRLPPVTHLWLGRDAEGRRGGEA